MIQGLEDIYSAHKVKHWTCVQITHTKNPKCKLRNIKTVNKTCQKRDLVEGC